MKSVSKTTVQCIDCEHIGKPKNISAGDLQMVRFGFGICENSENKSWFSLLYNRDGVKVVSKKFFYSCRLEPVDGGFNVVDKDGRPVTIFDFEKWRDGRRIVPVRTRFDPLGHRTFVLK